jgi:hypothetical protein
MVGIALRDKEISGGIPNQLWWDACGVPKNCSHTAAAAAAAAVDDPS